jgi:hypothetical protein
MSYAPDSLAAASEYEAFPPQGESPFQGEEFGEDGDSHEFESEFEGEFEDSFVAETPFLAGEAYAAGDTGLGAEIHELLAELYDTEFDEHLLELSDAAAEAAAESPFVQGETGSPSGERYLREWLEPLHQEAEAMLEAIGESFADQDIARLSEFELEELFAPHEPVAAGENPVFENFLGGLWKKAKAVVSGAVKLAKKGIAAVGSLLPINAILARLKTLVRPLLERVLQMAMSRLPPGLRPAAEQLKKRLFGEAELEDPASELVDSVPTTAEIAEVQREFDVNAASLLLANDEAEQDAVVAEAFEATAQDEDPINDLNRAREQLVAELEALPPGGDPLPAVQNFVPAVMAVSMIGRDRVVRFISQFIAPMIRPYTGPLAPQLSQAIASTGLSLMSLEAPVEPRAVASTALAGTVEDTVRRVAEDAGESLDHPELLEAAVASAFDEAAAQHFPPSLLKAKHRSVHVARSGDQRDHRQPHRAGRHHHSAGMWVRLPGARWYRRHTKTPTARITPATARHVRVFGGTTLEAFLRDHYGITGEVVAKAHLYEALPGATLGRIAAHERHTKGLGRARAYWKLQPLTPEIAGMLFGEPGLGRAVGPEYLARSQKIAVGQRFYYLELHRQRAALSAATVSAGAHPVPKPSVVNVRVDLPAHRLSVALHLSESDAQELAALARKPGPGIPKLLRQRLHDGLGVALSPAPAGHLRWIGAPATQRVLSDAIAARHLVRRVLGWVGPPLLRAVTQRPQDVISAADRPDDGITLLVHLGGVPPLHEQRVAGAPALAVREGLPAATVEIVPGFRSA